MAIIQIVDKQRNLYAEVKWDDDNLYINVLDDDIRSTLKALVEKAFAEGIQAHHGAQIVKDGKTILVEEIVTIQKDDEKFSLALANLISKSKLGKKRLFGLVKVVQASTEQPQDIS